MEQISIEIPYDFIAKKTLLTWGEIRYGIENNLFSPKHVVEIAIERLGTEANESPALLDLSIANPEEPVLDKVSEIASLESKQTIENIGRKWLYLLLSWIYEHRDQYDDPLGIVEKIYADFDYPEVIESVVRYMPSDGPNLGSKKLNEARIYDNLKEYLLSAGEEYALK